MSLPASARPSHEEQPVPPGLADRDNDRISDGLAADLKGREASEKINVVVTWTQPPDLAAAHNAAGPFDIYAQFAVVNGFAASLNASAWYEWARFGRLDLLWADSLPDAVHRGGLILFAALQIVEVTIKAVLLVAMLAWCRRDSAAPDRAPGMAPR